MNKEEIELGINSVITEIANLQLITPANYEDYNSLRLNYDIFQMRLQGYQLQLQALSVISQEETQAS